MKLKENPEYLYVLCTKQGNGKKEKNLPDPVIGNAYKVKRVDQDVYCSTTGTNLWYVVDDEITGFRYSAGLFEKISEEAYNAIILKDSIKETTTHDRQ